MSCCRRMIKNRMRKQISQNMSNSFEDMHVGTKDSSSDEDRNVKESEIVVVKEVGSAMAENEALISE